MEKSERLVSLDVFRGITIAGMILVNNPGSFAHIYPALGHASWNGVTPTDLIFPFFLFIVGVALTLSFAKRLAKGVSKGKLMLHVFKRAAIIFFLGLFMAAYPYFDFSTLRIPGVLQRIAVVYFFSSLIYLYFSKKSIIYWIIGLLTFYWATIMLFPVPGFGHGVLTKEGNFAAYLDRIFLTGHMWKGSRTWDPEGIFSTIPAICTALFGVLSGYMLKSEKSKEEKTNLLFFWGCILTVLGVVLDMWLPFNKSLWTSSYSVYCAGMALLFLAACFFLIDIKGYKKWATPFLVYGTNAITVFFLSGLVGKQMGLIKVALADGTQTSLTNWIYLNCFASWLGLVNGSLAYAICYVLIWLGLMWILYAKKIFIKV